MNEAGMNEEAIRRQLKKLSRQLKKLRPFGARDFDLGAFKIEVLSPGGVPNTIWAYETNGKSGFMFLDSDGDARFKILDLLKVNDQRLRRAWTEAHDLVDQYKAAPENNRPRVIVSYDYKSESPSVSILF